MLEAGIGDRAQLGAQRTVDGNGGDAAQQLGCSRRAGELDADAERIPKQQLLIAEEGTCGQLKTDSPASEPLDHRREIGASEGDVIHAASRCHVRFVTAFHQVHDGVRPAYNQWPRDLNGGRQPSRSPTISQ